MSNILKFVERSPNAAPIVLIEARRFLNGFRYSVKRPIDPLAHPDNFFADADAGLLDTYSLHDARANAEYWGKQVVETGPAEAFGEGPG